jgi:chaperonin GroES
MPYSIKPLADRLVVKPLEQEVQTFAGGELVLPDTAKEKPQQGEVIAVGPGRIEDGERVPLEIKVGDKVVFAKYAGTKYKTEDGDEIQFMKESDILAVLE